MVDCFLAGHPAIPLITDQTSMRNVKGLIKNFLPMERFYCISYYCVDFMAHNFTILVTATINLVSSNKKAPN